MGGRTIDERIHVSPRFGVGALRIKAGDSDPLCCSELATQKRHKFPTPNPKDTRTVQILALDLGKFNTMCCFLDTKTRKYSFLNAPTERNYLNTLFKNHKVDCVVIEACEPSDWINDLAISYGLKTLVCSTNEDACRVFS